VPFAPRRSTVTALVADGLWDGDTAVVPLVVTATVALVHLLTNQRYGLHRDELQVLSDARHLDWGFVPYPPLTPFVERIGLGIFAGGGILLQVDGMAYTSASTSAFLTQCYCVIIPLWVAWRERRWPPPIALLGCALVVAGVAVLANVDWRNFRLGRGELETIAASVLFTGQILWLERPQYSRNKVNHFSLVMFAVMSLVCLPVAVLTTQQPADWLWAYSSPPTLGFPGCS